GDRAGGSAGAGRRQVEAALGWHATPGRDRTGHRQRPGRVVVGRTDRRAGPGAAGGLPGAAATARCGHLRAGQHPPGRGRDRGLRARDPAGPGPGGVPRYAGGTDRGRPRHHGRGRADRARVYRHPARRPRRSAGVSAARRAGSGATRHVLRTELRRSTAGVAAVATLALGASLLVAEASSWAGRWMGLAAAVRFSTLLLAPAAVALGV